MWGGSSITINSNTWAFRNRAASELLASVPHFAWTFQAAAVSGQATWAQLVKLSANVLAYSPDLVVLDTANNDGSTMDNATIEAYVRRVWAANPETRILLWNFFAVADQNVNTNVNTPTDVGNVLATNAVAAHYNIPLLDYWGTIKQRVNDEGHNLNEFMNDTIHPNETGHNEAYTLLEPKLLASDGTQPETLPARLYAASSDFEYTPTIQNGTDYDSRTGAWTDAGTVVSSISAGATITYSFTGRSFGIFRADSTYPSQEISIDGGAFVLTPLYANGVDIGTRAAHTIIIRVVASIKIEEFWSI